MNQEKKYQTTPQQIRRKIISLVQRFQELSKEVAILPSPIRLKGIITTSAKLNKITTTVKLGTRITLNYTLNLTKMTILT
jgi:hypothetical protein